MDLDKLMTISFTWDNRESILACLSKELNVKFAILCAESILHHFEKECPDDKRPRRAIETTKLYLEGRATEKECANAATAATAAYATAANAAAYAAAYAAYAANAAANAAAYAAAYAAYAAAYAAARAAAAANAAATAAYATATATAATAAATDLFVKEQIMDYLRDLIISSLTEEQKENWLLMATL